MLMLKEKMTTKSLTRLSLLSAIALLLVYLEFPLGFFPTWLKLDFSDVPALIGAFAMGPVAGVVIELIKNVLKLLVKSSETSGIGELANFLMGSAFVLTAGLIYHRNKTLKRAVIGMIAGIFMMTLFGALTNYFMLLPFFGMTDVRWDMVIKVLTPFNLLKGTIICLITIPLYKKVSSMLHR